MIGARIVINITDKTKCCGCSGCFNVCPKNCITMEEDIEGFLYPKVDESACINCGCCEKVCPVINPIKEERKTQQAFLVQHKDEEVRLDSAAGGAFTAIATFIINQGGIVFGAAYDNNFQVVHTYVDRLEDLKKFRNSKYVQSKIGESFKDSKKFLKEDKWVCFSGTPCQIEGLKRYLGKSYEKLILVDVVCHGIPSPLIWNKYLEYQKIEEKKPENIRFRDKYYGYKYSTMSLIKNGKNIYHAGAQLDPMLRAFFSDMSDRPICYNCPFKKRYRISDMTIWDCFSVYNFDKKMDDDKGTTRVLCHTGKGCILILNIKEIISYKEADSDKLVYGVKEMFESVEENPKRKQFFEDAVKLNGKDLFNKYFPVTVKIQLVTYIRSLLVITGIYSTIKRLKTKLESR